MSRKHIPNGSFSIVHYLRKNKKTDKSKSCKMEELEMLLKACVAIFYELFFFHQMVALQKL